MIKLDLPGDIFNKRNILDALLIVGEKKERKQNGVIEDRPEKEQIALGPDHNIEPRDKKKKIVFQLSVLGSPPPQTSKRFLASQKGSSSVRRIKAMRREKPLLHRC
jgi:hypothetical protein